MILPGTEQRALHQALMSAFPTRSALERMVRFGLDTNIHEIADGGSLEDVAFSLIQHFIARGSVAELVRAAFAENPGNPLLKQVAARLLPPPAPAASPGGPAAPDERLADDAPPLGEPPTGAAGVLVDLSHAQDEWETSERVIFHLADDGELQSALQAPGFQPRWWPQAIRDRRQIRARELRAWRGMILGLPYHVRLEEATRYEIVQWVRQGGRLVLLGFELSDRHHETNLNDLAGEFGLRFNTDIVAPAGWSDGPKPYGAAVDFDVESAHPLLADIRRLQLHNLCTLTVEPGAEVLLTLGDNGIGWNLSDTVRYTPNGWLRGGYHRFAVLRPAHWVPVAAFAPAGLCGKGQVLAIGTWELVRRGFRPEPGFDNLRLVERILGWCAGA